MRLKTLRMLFSTLLILYPIAIFISFFHPSFGTLSLPAGTDKFIHFIEFFLLTLLLFKTLEFYNLNKRLAPFLSLFIIALSTEIIQLFISTRSFAWIDFIADSFGIALGMITYLVISWKR